MKKIIVLAVFALALMSCTDPDVKSVRELARRVVPGSAGGFEFECAPADSDYFAISSAGGKVHIKGNNAVSMATGLNYYLKYICNVDYGWLPSCGTPVLPDPLPEVPEPVCCKARVDKRFFLNYCTFGYTMPWWKWEEWERCIDWMALNGVNLPLAITGQESIWYQVWKKLVMKDE